MLIRVYHSKGHSNEPIYQFTICTIEIIFLRIHWVEICGHIGQRFSSQYCVFNGMHILELHEYCTQLPYTHTQKTYISFACTNYIYTFKLIKLRIILSVLRRQTSNIKFSFKWEHPNKHDGSIKQNQSTQTSCHFLFLLWTLQSNKRF